MAVTKTITPVIYTTTQLNDILSRLVRCMNTAGNKDYKGRQYGYCDCSYYSLFRQMVRAYYLLSTWQQTPSGSTTGYTNYITQTQLTATILWVKKHCNC